MNSKRDQELEASANQAMRPATYALGAVVVACVLAVVLSAAAPDVFAAVGGWVTFALVVVAASLWAGLSIVRRTRRNAAQDEPGAGR
ncbi:MULTISPECIES: hypothetical protein [unclassified Isoptericola]|uniref:hypothetical protein n=1 Tax=Isoptericola sp. NPDC057191 TaxID=3346041 RepID=UPI0036308ECA